MHAKILKYLPASLGWSRYYFVMARTPPSFYFYLLRSKYDRRDQALIAWQMGFDVDVTKSSSDNMIVVESHARRIKVVVKFPKKAAVTQQNQVTPPTEPVSSSV